MVRNDDAAVNSVACVHSIGVASFKVTSLFSLQLSSPADSSRQHSYACVHMNVAKHRSPFPFVADVGHHSQQLTENYKRNSVVGRLPPAVFQMSFLLFACCFSAIFQKCF